MPRTMQAEPMPRPMHAMCRDPEAPVENEGAVPIRFKESIAQGGAWSLVVRKNVGYVLVMLKQGGETTTADTYECVSMQTDKFVRPVNGGALPLSSVADIQHVKCPDGILRFIKSQLHFIICERLEASAGYAGRPTMDASFYFETPRGIGCRFDATFAKGDALADIGAQQECAGCTAQGASSRLP